MRFGRRLRIVLAGSAAAAVVLFSSPSSADTTTHPNRVGDLTIIAADSGKTITRGASSTQFQLVLPENSTCPGDSANDDWRTQGFLAPVGIDPATLQYNAVGAVGPGVFPLFEVNTRSYRHELLEPNDKAGEPGHIPRVPPMSFATYPPDYVPPGRYVIGIACTYFRSLDKYWTVTVDVVKDPKDSPAQLTWSVVGAAPATSSSSGNNRLPLEVAFIAIAAGAIVFVIRGGKQRPAVARTGKEKS